MTTPEAITYAPGSRPYFHELIKRIESDESLAPWWAMVFEAPSTPDPIEPPPKPKAAYDQWLATMTSRRAKAARAGRLHPDAAHEISTRLREVFPGLTIKLVTEAKRRSANHA